MKIKFSKAFQSLTAILLTISFVAGSGSAAPRAQTDRDNDGLSDTKEQAIKTNPRKADTDGDFLFDGAEVKTFKTSPLKKRTRGRVLDGNADSDRDGIPNEDEDDVAGTPKISSNRDADEDGIVDEDEDERGFNPFRRDTDGDGIDDGDEDENDDDDSSSSSTSSASSSNSSSSSSSSSSSNSSSDNDEDDSSNSSSSRGR